jgi:flavodoxin
MKTLLVYDTTYGTTERIARAIARRLGGVRLIKAEEAGSLASPPCDLLIIGGPTHPSCTAKIRQRPSVDLAPTWATCEGVCR